GEIYLRLKGQDPDAWRARFYASPYYARYVTGRMPLVQSGRRPTAAAGPAHRRGAGDVRQAWVLTRRYLATWRGNWTALLVLLGQALRTAALLALVFGALERLDPPVRVGRTVSLLFLLGVSSFWFGCNTAAKELVKERVIFLRERAINLRVGGYLASKF